MSTTTQPSMAEFFNWRRHPFTDTYPLKQPFLSRRDERIRLQALSLLANGKSMALIGSSGTGKSTLVHHLIHSLDPHHYRPVLIHYGGLRRSGLLRAVADALGVDPSGRNVPLIVKIHKQISRLRTETNSLFPVFVIDDAQLLERESLLDLCSLMSLPSKSTVAAALILVGDPTLAHSLQLRILDPISTRLTARFQLDSLDEEEAVAFVRFRLQLAQASYELFSLEALALIASHCHGNRRRIMNVGTLLLEEAFLRQEKSVSPQLVLDSDLIDFALS